VRSSHQDGIFKCARILNMRQNACERKKGDYKGARRNPSDCKDLSLITSAGEKEEGWRKQLESCAKASSAK
jgi:hypothetical protein